MRPCVLFLAINCRELCSSAVCGPIQRPHLPPPKTAAATTTVGAKATLMKSLKVNTVAAAVTGGTITIGRAAAEAEVEVAMAAEVVETIDTTIGTTIGTKGMVRAIGGSIRVENAIIIAATAVITTGAATATKGMACTASREAEEGRIEDGETIRPTNLLRLRQQLRAAVAAVGTRLLQIVFERG